MRERVPNRRMAAALSAAVLVAASVAAAVAAAVAPTAAPAAEQLAPLIVIDPGHGGPYSNANANGLKEKNVNLWVARALRDRLLARGYRVAMTRTADRAVAYGDVPTWNYRSWDGSWHYRTDGVRGMDGSIPEDDLQARAQVANRAGADLFISVHANGSLSRYTRGYETWASRRDYQGRKLASYVQESVIARTRLRDRGAKTRDYYVLRWTNMPAILVETAFISNRYDAALLKSASFRGKIASGIADGVDRWFATRPFRPFLPRLGAASTAEHAVALSRASFPAGAPVAVVARSDRWADAPGAASLAAAMGCPLLWASASGMASSTAEELTRLAPERVLVVGTTESVASMDATAMAAAASVETSSVDFLTAETTASLAASIAESSGVGPNGTVYIAPASGKTAWMSAAAVAAATTSPLLLAEDGVLPPEAQAFIGANRGLIERVVLVGTTAQVPGRLASGIPVVRCAATDFPTLFGLLNDQAFPDRTPDSIVPVTADRRWGQEFLASASRAGLLGQPLLPMEGDVMPPRTRQWITNRRSVIRTFEVHEARGRTRPLMDRMLRKADYL